MVRRFLDIAEEEFAKLEIFPQRLRDQLFRCNTDDPGARSESAGEVTVERHGQLLRRCLLKFFLHDATWLRGSNGRALGSIARLAQKLNVALGTAAAGGDRNDVIEL